MAQLSDQDHLPWIISRQKPECQFQLHSPSPPSSQPSSPLDSSSYCHPDVSWHRSHPVPGNLDHRRWNDFSQHTSSGEVVCPCSPGLRTRHDGRCTHRGRGQQTWHPLGRGGRLRTELLTDSRLLYWEDLTTHTRKE